MEAELWNVAIYRSRRVDRWILKASENAQSQNFFSVVFKDVPFG